MSNAREAQLRQLMQSYLDGEADFSGVLIVVNEEEERIETMLVNTTSTQGYLLILHSLQTLYENAVNTTYFTNTVQ